MNFGSTKSCRKFGSISLVRSDHTPQSHAALIFATLGGSVYFCTSTLFNTRQSVRLIYEHWAVHRIPEPIVINVGYVFVQEFCYTFSKHKISIILCYLLLLEAAL